MILISDFLIDDSVVMTTLISSAERSVIHLLKAYEYNNNNNTTLIKKIYKLTSAQYILTEAGHMTSTGHSLR